MDDKKFNLILDKLLERTEEGKLEWKTTANEETFLVILSDSSISISQINDYVPDMDGNARSYCYYTFDFRNEDGKIFDSVIIPETMKKDFKYKKAERIFFLARGQSLKIDQTVDRIIEQLAA